MSCIGVPLHTTTTTLIVKLSLEEVLLIDLKQFDNIFTTLIIPIIQGRGIIYGFGPFMPGDQYIRLPKIYY